MSGTCASLSAEPENRSFGVSTRPGQPWWWSWAKAGRTHHLPSSQQCGDSTVSFPAGVYFFIGGERRRFDDQLDGRGVGPLDHRHPVILGRVGWIGRGVMLALIG